MDTEKFKELMLRHYAEQKTSEAGDAELTDFLIEKQLIKEQTMRNYAIAAEYAEMRKSDRQIKAILAELGKKYDLHPRTVRDIVDEYSADFGL